jgi:hypothetical protein
MNQFPIRLKVLLLLLVFVTTINAVSYHGDIVKMLRDPGQRPGCFTNTATIPNLPAAIGELVEENTDPNAVREIFHNDDWMHKVVNWSDYRSLRHFNSEIVFRLVSHVMNLSLLNFLKIG